jgi:general nucleoside transport system permease protein
MLESIFSVAFATSLIAGTIRLATPILYAALGELVTERSGVLNLGVEGSMLMGAFAGFFFAHRTGSQWIGFIMAMVIGGLMGLILAFLVATLKTNQVVAGLSLNILASGLSFYLYRIAFPDAGGSTMPTVPTFPEIKIPILSEIPILGPALFNHVIITYLVFLAVPVMFFVLYRTTIGLELRALGDNPRAVDTKGINIPLFQYAAIIFGGMMAGAGGSVLTLSATGMFVPDITAGRGWIALAIVIFGNWQPYMVLLGALFFGLLDSFQLQIQGVGVQMPYQILLAIPYVLTIVALLVRQKRSGEPLALGEPYFRE